MTRILAFLQNKKYLDLLLVKLKKIKEDFVIIGFDSDICKELQKRNVDYCNINDYSKNVDIEKKSIGWIKAWPNQQVAGGKNFKEYFSYEKVSLWWLMDLYLYLTSIFFQSYQNILAKAEKTKNVIYKENPKKVVFVDDGKEEAVIIKEFCRLKKTDTIVLVRKKSNEAVNFYKRKSLVAYKLARNLVRDICWKAISLFDFKKRKGKYSVLVCVESQWGKIWDEELKKETVGDTRFYHIIKELEKRKKFKVVVVDNPTGSGLRLKYFNRRINRFSENPPIERYISVSSIFESFKNKKLFYEMYKKVRNNLKFYYEGIDLKKVLEPKINFFFSDYILETFLFFSMVKNAIKKEKPSIILVSGDINPYHRIAIGLGRKKKIPSLYSQHGAAGYSVCSVNKKYDMPPERFSTSPYLTMPNYQCVYGEYYKRFFLKYTKYSSNNIFITGNPKYDSATNMLTQLDKKTLKKKFGLDKNKKTILFFSIPFNDYQYRDLFLDEVYESFRKLEHVEILVKLHPNEIKKSIHKTIILKKGLKNCRIFEDEDIFELGLSSNLVVTGNSTTVMDMAAIKKPIIIFDPSKRDAYSKQYANMNAGILVHDSVELSNQIGNILKDENFSNKIVKKQKSFIEKFLYKIDGNASKRIVDKIEEVTMKKIW